MFSKKDICMSQCAKRALLLPGNLLWLRGIELQTCYEGQHSVQHTAGSVLLCATIEKGLLCKPPTVVLLSWLNGLGSKIERCSNITTLQAEVVKERPSLLRCMPPALSSPFVETNMQLDLLLFFYSLSFCYFFGLFFIYSTSAQYERNKFYLDT